MSFAGFGAALGNLFGGVAGSLQEQEKLRMAREFQAKQMEDMGAQMEERKANAAYRLAEAERQKQLASPEVQRLIKLAMSGGEGSDDATAQLIAMDASRFGTLLKPKTPSPVNRQQATLKGPNGEPMAASFDTTTGKHYDAAGNEIANPVRYTPPRNDTLGSDVKKAQLAHSIAAREVALLKGNLDEASKVANDPMLMGASTIPGTPGYNPKAMHAQTLVGMAQKKYNDAQARMQDAQLRLMGMLGGQQSSLPPDIDPAEFAQFQQSLKPPTP
jgi:hypothetical protein